MKVPWLFCLATTLYMSSVFGDVYKWKDADGETHYGDAPPVVEAEKIRIDKQTDDEIAHSNKMNAEAGHSISQKTTRDPKCEKLLDRLSNTRVNPSTQSFGQMFSAKAKRNAITQEYELRCMSSGDRQVSEERRQEKRSNAQTQNQLRQIQQTQEETMRAADDIRRMQKYGY